jgi:peptidoglycan/LPS O-acetylase OafA/YrhL
VKHRDDIQGLRAVAVLLVIFAHVGIAGFAGGWIGVDVFFVISGFLITGLLIREYRETRHVSLLQFYVRRAKRILPASLITILVVLIASNLLLNSIRTANIRTDAFWAVGFVSNIHYIKINTDYFTSGQAVSPLQHFWSLAVEEQFYLIWPALFLLVSRQRGLRIKGSAIRRRHRVLLVAAIASALSLIWSIFYSYSNPTSAYFSTLTRVWELGFGVLLACTVPQIQKFTKRMPDRLRSVVLAITSWTGLAAIMLGACVVIKPGDPFPGYLALIPVLGAVGIIFGGLDEKQPIPNRILSIRPLTFIGTISFSLYLWHWPVHVFADALYPDSVNTTVGILAQLAVIFAISLISYYLIENPTRHLKVGQRELTKKRLSEITRVPIPAVVVLSVSAAFLLIVSVDVSPSRTADAQITMESSNIFIPTSTTTTVQNPSAVTTPESASTQQADWAKQVAESVGFTSADSKMQDFISRVSKEKLREACNPAPVGCTIGSSGAAKSVALLGDSHAYMFASTVATMLPDWLIRDYSTGSCIAASIDFANNKQEQMGGNSLEECVNSRNSAIEDIVARPPDLVIISDRTSWVVKDKQTTAWEIGERETYDRLSSISTKTKVVRFGETPSVETRWDRCLTASGSIKTCFGSRGDIAEALTNVQSVAKRYPWVQFVDVSTWLCSGDICPPVINGIPVYIDAGHLSLEFRPLLAPLLKAAINI